MGPAASNNDEGAVTTTGWALAGALLVPGVQYPTITLDLQNVAKISTTVLEEAKETLARIYRAAGIQVQWNTAAADFTAVLRSPPHPEAVRNSQFALGYAPRTSSDRGRLVFVMVDRTEVTASGLGVPHHLVLGMTMAHEVAHLLLPDAGHSRSGIMRDSWTPSDYVKARLGQFFFTRNEARLMRDALAVIHSGSRP